MERDNLLAVARHVHSALIGRIVRSVDLWLTPSKVNV